MARLTGVLVACIFSWSASFCQEGPISKTKEEIVFYLDSQRITKDYIFDANDIEAINVVKGADSSGAGTLYLKSKNPKIFSWLSLSQVRGRFITTPAPVTLFLLNNQIISDDPGAYRIDSAFILTVDVHEGKNIQSLQPGMSGLVILNIITKTKENIERQAAKQSQIILRGANDGLL